MAVGGYDGIAGRFGNRAEPGLAEANALLRILTLNLISG